MKNKLMLGGNIFGHFTTPLQTAEILQKARDLEIFAIDTADVYSNGLSEELIGQNIKSDRSKWFLATKAGIASDGSPIGLGRKKTLFHKLEESLKRLQTDYIDLYQIHHFDPETALEETLEAFEELIQQGKIRAAGISNYHFEHLTALKKETKKPITFHQMDLNLTNYQSQKKILQECNEQKLSIAAYSSLVRGLFSEKYLLGHVPEGSRAAISKKVQGDLTPNFLTHLQETAALCRAYDISLPALALQWISQKKEVGWVIVGVRNQEQLFSIHQTTIIKPLPPSFFIEAEQIWSSFK